MKQNTSCFLRLTLLVLLLTLCLFSVSMAVDEDISGDGAVNSADNRLHTSSTVPFLITIHMEAKTARKCDVKGVPCKTEAEWQDMMSQLEALISAFDRNGLKGTFQMQIQWLTRLQESKRGLAIIDTLFANGHEIGIHRHGFDHNGWDGYSDNPLAYTQPHQVYTNLKARPMSEYMNLVEAFQKKYNYVLVTWEGTDRQHDHQPDWIFTTTGHFNSPTNSPIDDPNDACANAHPFRARTMAVPTEPRIFGVGGNRTAGIPHTYFIGWGAGCQRVIADNLLSRIEALAPNTISPQSVVHILFHVYDYMRMGAQPEYDAAFERIANVDFLEPMTVRDFMCKRVQICP